MWYTYSHMYVCMFLFVYSSLFLQVLALDLHSQWFAQAPGQRQEVEQRSASPLIGSRIKPPSTHSFTASLGFFFTSLCLLSRSSLAFCSGSQSGTTEGIGITVELLFNLLNFVPCNLYEGLCFNESLWKEKWSLVSNPPCVCVQHIRLLIHTPLHTTHQLVCLTVAFYKFTPFVCVRVCACSRDRLVYCVWANPC